jgi:hypothetical protein
MSKRKHRDRKPPSERNNRRDFQLAYAAEVLAVAPCAGCWERKPTRVAVWEPPRDVLRAHGLDNGKRHRYGYRVCDSCAARAQRDPMFVEDLENRILAEASTPNCVKVQTP